MADKKYTASVVGCGVGGCMSLNALAASDRFELVAACDVNEAARHAVAERFPRVLTYASHQELFEENGADVVCVSTWPPSHREVVLAALDLPSVKGMLVEKPLADSYAAGKGLLDALRAKGLPVCVPHGLLKLNHCREILRRVHAGDIGILKLVEIQCTGWDIINAGIHWLNFFVMLTRCEPVAYVIAQCDRSTRTHRDGMQVETFGITYGETASGVRVVMNTGDQVAVSREGKDFLFRIVGTEGIIEFWAWESAYSILNELHSTGHLVEVEPAPDLPHQLHLEALAQQMDTQQPDYMDAESSLMALEMVEAAYVSSRFGTKVEFPLCNFKPPTPNDWEPGKPFVTKERKLERFE